MCNCGKNRTALKQQSNISQNNYQKAQTSPMQIKPAVLFQYTGKTALTVVGNITRKSYRFKFPGDIQQIDVTDATAMTAVPVLKRM